MAMSDADVRGEAHAERMWTDADYRRHVLEHYPTPENLVIEEERRDYARRETRARTKAAKEAMRGAVVAAVVLAMLGPVPAMIVGVLQ